MTQTQKTLTALKAIPPEKLSAKVWRTFWGLAIGAVAVAAVVRWSAPWYVAVAGVFLSGVIASGELVLAPVKLAGSALIDLWKRFKGDAPAA